MKKINITKDKIIKELKIIGFIFIGTITGALCYKICLDLNLAIFGWNIGLLISPILAGYVETYLSEKYVHESTGAISAFILFLITVIYGFIITNPTLGPNLLTAGISVVILQAAFPILINYILIVFGITLIIYCSGIWSYIKKQVRKITGKVYYIITGKQKAVPEIEEPQITKKELVDVNELGILFLSSNDPINKKIAEYKGIFESASFIRYDEKQILKLKDEELCNKILIEDIEYAKNRTFVKLAEKLKNNGCNGLLELNIQYDQVKREKTELIIQVSVNGTGILFE